MANKATDAVLEIALVCKCCGEGQKLTVPLAAYHNWRQKRMKIQNALPMLTADERELLMSGICGKCFDRIFKEDD